MGPEPIITGRGVEEGWGRYLMQQQKMVVMDSGFALTRAPE